MEEILNIAKKITKIGGSQAKYWIEKSFGIMGNQATKVIQAKITQDLLDNMKKTFNFLGYISEDNSLMHLITGQFEVSEATINSFLVEMPEENLRNLHVRVDSNILWIIGEGNFGGTPVMVEIPLEFMGFDFTETNKKAYFRIKEFPRMATPQTLRGGIMRLAAVVAKSFLGEESLYEKFIEDIDGVTIEGKEVTVDLNAIPALNSLLSKKIFKWTLSDILNVERVVFIPGKVKIFGGIEYSKLFSFTEDETSL